MQIFIDTGDVNEIKEAASWGIIDGVTTNPSLIAKTGKEFNREFVEEIIKIVHGPISIEVIHEDSQGMIEEARWLSQIHENIVVKIPMTLEGLKAIRKLSQENIKTNATLIFSVNQALLVAKAGATYVSPFLGRLDDVGENGLDLVKDILQVFKNYKFSTKVIAASIRNPIHVKVCALLGCNVITIPFKVLEQLSKHPLTNIGIKCFLDDWQKVPKGKNK